MSDSDFLFFSKAVWATRPVTPPCASLKQLPAFGTSTSAHWVLSGVGGELAASHLVVPSADAAPRALPEGLSDVSRKSLAADRQRCVGVRSFCTYLSLFVSDIGFICVQFLLLFFL